MTEQEVKIFITNYTKVYQEYCKERNRIRDDDAVP